MGEQQTVFGPLFGKELLEIARRRRYYVARFAVGVALFAGWWMTFGGRELTVEFGRLSELAAIGRTLYEGWAGGALLIGVLLAPALACGLIAGEKDNRTFDVLLTTLLKDREILLGKIASRMAFLLVLLASSVPILSLASLYGGFDAIQVIATAGTVFGLCLFALLVGLYYSTITFKPYVALLRAYFALALLWLLVPAIPNQEWWNVPFSPRIALLSASNVMAKAPGSINPIPIWRTGAAGRTTMTIVTPISPNGQLPAHNLAATAGVHLLAGWLILWRTAYLLRRRLQPGKPPWIFRAMKRLYGALIGGARGFVERRQKSVGLGHLWKAEAVTMRWADARRASLGDRNPLGLRNATANVYDPERYITAFQLVSLAAIVVGFGFVGYFAPNLAMFDSAMPARMLGWTFAAHSVCTVVLAASAFARERQSGSWDLVMLADLSPQAHLWSAFWGVARVMRPLTVLAVILWIMATLISGGGEGSALWTLSAVCLWWNAVALALCASLCHGRIAAAVGAAFGGLVLFAVAEPWFASVLRRWADVLFLHPQPLRWLLSSESIAHLVILIFGLPLFLRFAPKYWRLLLLVLLASQTYVAFASVSQQVTFGNSPSQRGGVAFSSLVTWLGVQQPHNTVIAYVMGMGEYGRHPFFGASYSYGYGRQGPLYGATLVLALQTVLLLTVSYVWFPRLQPRRAETRRGIWPARRAVVK